MPLTLSFELNEKECEPPDAPLIEIVSNDKEATEESPELVTKESVKIQHYESLGKVVFTTVQVVA